MQEWKELTEVSKKRWDTNAEFWDDYMSCFLVMALSLMAWKNPLLKRIIREDLNGLIYRPH